MRPKLPVLRRRHAGASGRAAVRGVVLIEVMVALLIFLLGILGFIGLQTSLTRVQSEADLRANAAYLSNEVIGRMWSDIGHLSGYAGTDSCTATGCIEWRTKMQQVLPGGTASIAVDAATGNVSIKLGWTLPGGITHQYETQSNISAKSAT
ncbi:pilus assembly protein PilV [Variovorax sp. M-6]|uniref:type IV pilus modification PilV family protein n=1 Tax=Variovorax sp. M-6 TaxID=3233041 RepID=UPI003F94D412